MAKNVEIKARLHDPAAAHAVAARLSGQRPEVFSQKDVFFRCASGRLKLRFLAGQPSELIQYHRPDTSEAKTSDYVIARTAEPDALLEVLTRALGTIGTVEKSRSLYLIDQTRVHIDTVAGLGNFLEFEVCLRAGESEAHGRQVAAALLGQFAILPEDLIDCAYIDLLSAAHRI